jgi:branched-chain amino acid transport system substrate-binding protein
MVVGHGYSTTTKSALPNYLGADPPVPVILTTETNPTLVPSSPNRTGEVVVPPVFRLFPTDDNQAAVAAKFFADQGATKVWVVQDTANPTYSEYLARAFLKAAYDHQPQLKVILWSNNLSLPPYSVEKLGIDWVFFAGDPMNALVLVRQIKALQLAKPPRVLLSDASADKSLVTYGKGELEGVYLMHPLSPVVFTQTGYEIVGDEASKLTVDLVAKAHEDFDHLATDTAPVSYRLRKLFGLHRVSDARRAIAQYMSVAVLNGNPLTPGDSPISMTRANGNGPVIRKDASFHVWKIENDTFVPVPGY